MDTLRAYFDKARKAIVGLIKEPTLREKLEDLFKQSENSFYVYDGRGNMWGHAIYIHHKQTLENLDVHSISGFRELRRPVNGDRLALQMKSGKFGLFMLYEVEHKSDPRDMFSAKIVQVEADYKGGFGVKGSEQTETVWGNYPSLT